MKLISRLAPTPSGNLHIGNAYNFLLTWLYIRSNEGVLHLRIDDYDLVRSSYEFIQNCFEVIKWLKIDYDFGARNLDDFKQNFSSKFRFKHYKQSLEKLRQNSNLTYNCSCTRSSIKTQIYPQICFGKDIGLDDANIRVHIPKDTIISIENQQIYLDKVFGDFVIFRKQNLPSYQFASVLDDELLGVNFIVRGSDLLYSSAAQMYLARIMGLENFQKVRFVHHKLFYDEQNNKLSKSKNSSFIKLNQSPKICYKLVADSLSLNYRSNYDLKDLLSLFKEKFHSF